MLSLTDAPLLSMAGDIRFDVVVPEHAMRRKVKPLRAWSRQVRQGLGLRGPAHALLADAHGVWAWSPADCFAAATRHAGLREWMRANPGADVRLWVSGDLTRDIEDVTTLPGRDDAGLRSHARQAFVDQHGDAAASWPLATWRNDVSLGVVALAGIDLDAARRHGAQSGVRIRSVAPWWHHAFLEARCCVPSLVQAKRAHLCVVEGRAAAWISLTNGVMRHLRRCMLEEASVESLCAAMARMRADDVGDDIPTVVLGHGLGDGGDTSRLDALVLGRLDGEQPPQWLRPATQLEVH
jgi:hypothetical protein